MLHAALYWVWSAHRGMKPCSGPLTAPVKGHTIRVVTIDNAPWFVAADVLAALGYHPQSFTTILLKIDRNDIHLNPIEGKRGIRKMNVISEAGLYKLALRSDKPEAKAFQDWVTRDVLPAIRKDGGFAAFFSAQRSTQQTQYMLRSQPSSRHWLHLLRLALIGVRVRIPIMLALLVRLVKEPLKPVAKPASSL